MELATKKAENAIIELEHVAKKAEKAKGNYDTKMLMRKRAGENAKKMEGKAEEALEAQTTKQEAEKAAQREAASTGARLAVEALKRVEVVYQMAEVQLTEAALRAEESADEAVEVEKAFEKDDSETEERQIKEDALVERVASNLQSMDLKDIQCKLGKLRTAQERKLILDLELEVTKWRQQQQGYQDALIASQRSVDSQNRPKFEHTRLGASKQQRALPKVSIAALAYQQIRAQMAQDKFANGGRRLLQSNEPDEAGPVSRPVVSNVGAYMALSGMQINGDVTVTKAMPDLCQQLCEHDTTCAAFQITPDDQCSQITAEQIGEGWTASAMSDLYLKSPANAESAPQNMFYRFLLDTGDQNSFNIRTMDSSQLFKAAVSAIAKHTKLPESYLSTLNNVALVNQIPLISATTCYSLPDASDYRGTINVTQSGRPCQEWSLQTPVEHSYLPDQYPEAGIQPNDNSCRNPDNKPGGAWCYSSDGESPAWEFCNLGRSQCQNRQMPSYECCTGDAGRVPIGIDELSCDEEDAALVISRSPCVLRCTTKEECQQRGHEVCSKLPQCRAVQITETPKDEDPFSCKLLRAPGVCSESAVDTVCTKQLQAGLNGTGAATVQFNNKTVLIDTVTGLLSASGESIQLQDNEYFELNSESIEHFGANDFMIQFKLQFDPDGNLTPDGAYASLFAKAGLTSHVGPAAFLHGSDIIFRLHSNDQMACEGVVPSEAPDGEANVKLVLKFERIQQLLQVSVNGEQKCAHTMTQLIESSEYSSSNLRFGASLSDHMQENIVATFSDIQMSDSVASGAAEVLLQRWAFAEGFGKQTADVVTRQLLDLPRGITWSSAGVAPAGKWNCIMLNGGATLSLPPITGAMHIGPAPETTVTLWIKTKGTKQQLISFGPAAGEQLLCL